MRGDAPGRPLLGPLRAFRRRLDVREPGRRRCRAGRRGLRRPGVAVDHHADPAARRCERWSRRRPGRRRGAGHDGLARPGRCWWRWRSRSAYSCSGGGRDRTTAPRPHPVAWWVWAIGLATAATVSTNPVWMVLLVAVSTVVVFAPLDQPWARSFHSTAPSRWRSWCCACSSGCCSAAGWARTCCSTCRRSAARLGDGHPPPGAGDRGVAVGWPVRRTPPGRDRGVRRCCERARQPQASPRIGPAGAVRDRHRARRLRLGAPATGRQRPSRPRRPGPPRRGRRPRARVAPPARPGAGGRVRTFGPARRRDGHPRLRPLGWRDPARAHDHRHADDRRPAGPVRGRLRPARPAGLDATLAGPADALGRHRGRVPRAVPRRPPGGTHALPGDPLAVARARRRRVRAAGRRRRPVRRQRDAHDRLPAPDVGAHSDARRSGRCPRRPHCPPWPRRRRRTRSPPRRPPA